MREGYRMIGHDFCLKEDVDWASDPLSGYRWPSWFYADLAIYRLPQGADVKLPWELSRHQYLFELGAAWRLTADDAIATDLRRLLLDWIDQNPIYQGINWTSSLEVGMRSISWIWILPAMAEWQGWQPGELQRIVSSMVDHATYLQSHFSYYSSPYNHLIGEATALYLLSQVLAEHPKADKWRKQAHKVLMTHAPRQFYQEGFSVEQGVSYHFYTLGFLTLAIVAARRFGRPLADLEPVVHHAFRAAMPFRRPDGRWPAVGDLDSARAMPVKPDDFWNFDGLCACGAVLFEDPELIAADAEAGEELFWLFGAQGIDRWEELKKKREEREHPSANKSPKGAVRRVMPDAGYVLASDGNDWMLFDAGPIAAGLFADATPSTAHGHADTLQVLYFADGRTILDDSGIPFYNGDPEWIRYFRSPQAHNTVEIEGVELVHSEGRLAWSREVKRPTLSAALADDAWLCCGRVEWPGVWWERSLLCLPGQGLWIADQIETDRPRQAAWYWQLPADARWNDEEAVAWDHFDLRRMSSSGGWESLLTVSRDDRPEGLRCHGYGEKAPGAVLVQRQRVEGRLLVLTSIGRRGRAQMGVEVDGLTAGSVSQTSGGATWRHGAYCWSRLDTHS